MSDLDVLGEIRQRFDSVDETGSGLVGYDGLCKLYEGADKVDIDQLMGILDLDGDGKFTYVDLVRVYNDADKEPTSNAARSPVILRKGHERRAVYETDNGLLSPIPQANTSSLRKSVEDLAIGQHTEPNVNRASRVWSWISDWGDLPVDGSYNSAPQDHSSPVPSFTEDEDGISSIKVMLQSICGSSDIMDSEAVQKLCKHAEAAPEDENDLRALLTELDTEKKGNVSMDNFARALQAAKYGAAVTSTPSPTYAARKRRFSQHTLGESFSGKPEYNIDSPRFTFTSLVVSEEQPSLSVLNVDNSGYIKISNLLKRWQEMGVKVSEKNEDLEMMLKMTLPIDSLGRVSVSDVTSLLESAISDDAGEYDSSLRCVALASFKSEIENLKKRVEEIEGENIQLKQTSTKIAEEKKRMVKEADESLESVTKSSAQKLEQEKTLHITKLNEVKRTLHSQARSSLAMYESEIERLKAQLHESRLKEKELNSQLKETKEELDAVNKQFHTALQEIQEKDKEWARLKDSFSVRLENTSTSNHDDLHKQIKELEVQLEQYCRMQQELKEEKQSVQDKYDCLVGEHEQLKRKHVNLQRQSKEERSAKYHSSAKRRDKPQDIAQRKKTSSDSDEPDESMKSKKDTVSTPNLIEELANTTLSKENEKLRENLEFQHKCLIEAQMSLQHQLQYYKKENSQLQVVLKETKFHIPREDGFQVYYENSTGPPTGSNHTQPQQLIQCDEQVIKMPISEIEEERKNNQILQEMLQTEHKQAVVDLSRCYDREGQYLQQIAKLKEENASLEQADFPETGEELMAQVNISSLTFNPSSHDETLTLMKSRLDAIRKSLSQTKRTHESSEVQNQLIKKLYEDMATLRALKEHSDQQLANLTTHKEQDDQIHSEERAGLKSSLQSMTRMYEQEMAAKNEELVNERKNIQKLSAQSAQFTLELQGYKDREEMYLQQLAKLNEMNESLVEGDFPETGEELMAQVALLTHTPNPSSYDETLASMKSQLDAVRESLKHTKRSLQSSQEQNQLIKKLYEDMANLRLLKEQSDQLHSEERVGLESSQQSINRKYEEALAAKNEELANGMKTIQMLTTQSAQIALELQGYKDREEKFLQQIEKLKDSTVEVDFLDASNEALMESDLLSISTPSSYDETLAHMKLLLDAVRDSLQHSRKSSQAEKQLITKLYEDIAYLQLLKKQSDQLHSEERAGLESSVQSIKESLAAKNEEFANEMKTIQMLTTQSAQTALELQGYKDREEKFLQHIEKLKEMNESLVEVDFPETGEQLMAQVALLTHTPNPSSYNETLAAMKSRLDAVRESLKHTKRSLQSSQEQNQLIKKLYEDIANLRLLKEQSDQLHSEVRAGLESSRQCIKESLAAKNEELANEMKTIHMLTTQSAQTALEVQGYKDREEKFLQQIEKLKKENKSLVEGTFLDTNEELLVQSDLLSVSNPSSYNETLALMKSRLHAVRESLKHTKHTPQSSQAQHQLINKLYEDMETLRILKEQSDELHSEERAGLISGLQSMDSKYEQEMAARKNELDNETKTIQKLSAQSVQLTIELQGYKDREEMYLQQLAKLNEMSESLVEGDFPETGEELMAHVALLTHTPNPSSYDETLASMKSQLDAVRESLKHTKRSLQSSQEQNQLIKKLYEDMANLRLLKEQSDQLHSEERAGLESSVQSINKKYEEALTAKNEELANEMNAIQMLTTQSAQTALELQGYKDREEKFLQQIEKLKEENKSVVEATFPGASEELLMHSDLLSVSNPSSYDEALALMKSRLHAVSESLKHSKQSSHAQNQLINKLYEDMETLRTLKERSDKCHNEERTGLISSLHNMDNKYKQEMAAKKDELDNEARTIQKLSTQSAQIALELQGYKDREETYLQQIAKLKEMSESLVEVDFPETEVALLTSTPNPSSYDETLASMKSRLDAVKESLKHTKRSLQSSQEQKQLIKKLYEDVANLRLLKEQSDQLHSEERAGLESNVQSINRKYEEALAAKNEELANEMKTIHMLTTQSAQTALELQGYKDREKQIEKLKDENMFMPLVEPGFPDASEELLMHSDLLSVSNPSSYDETLALMKSRLHAVRESLKHTKHTPQSSQAQNQLISKLYEDMETLRILKEQSDKLHSEERAGLISGLQSMDSKNEQEMAARKNELDNETKTIQKLSAQSAQFTIELQGYKDREEMYLQQLAKLNEMNESQVEVDFPETGDELMAQVALLTHTPNPSSYNETLAAMKSRLDAVRVSLKHTKRSLQSSQEQNQLIKKLYEDIANLRLLKEQSDQLHSEERAGLESSVQSINRKYEEALAAKNEELANEMKTIHMLTTQSAHIALELQGYKDREEKFLQQIEKLREENKSVVEATLPDTNEELLVQSDMLSVSKPSSYNETLAMMKSHLHAIRESLKQTKHTHHSSQDQNQLINKLYEDMETLRILKEQSDELHSEERAGLISSLQSMDSKYEQEMAARKNELEEERKNAQKLLEFQSSQMAVELCHYKESEKLYLDQIAKLKGRTEALVGIDFPDSSEELLAGCNQSLISQPPTYKETLLQMRSAIDKLRQSLSHALQTSATLKQKEMLMRKLSGDIEDLRSHGEHNELLHCEEKTKLLTHTEQCNDEIHYLRADLQTMNSRCSEAAQEIVKASTMMANDHELLLELCEKLVNKEAEVQKYKGELESIQLAMLKQTSEAEEICTKDIEIARPQEQLVEHNKSKLDELNGEINHVSEHLQPISDMVKDDIVTEGQLSAHTMNMEDHKNREVLRKSNCYIFDQVKSMQTEIKNLRTLMLHSESQFRSDVERTALQFIENFISLKQKEISSFALQLMRQHEQEISVLQKELTLKSGSEVKSDLISMLNAKDHQLQETNGRLEVTRTEHAEQLRKLEEESRQLVQQYQVECKARQDCQQSVKEMIQKHSNELKEAKAAAEFQTSHLRELCISVTNCPLEAVCDLNHAGLLECIEHDIRRTIDQHSKALTQAKMLAEEQTSSLRKLCMETTNCSTDIVNGYSHQDLVELIRDEMKRVRNTFSNELSEAHLIASAQTDNLMKVCIAYANCSEEMVQGMNHTGLLECIKAEMEEALEKHSNELKEAKAATELQTSRLRELCISVTNCPVEAVCDLDHAGLMEYVEHDIHRKVDQASPKHSEALTRAKMLAEEQTSSLRKLCIETTNCSTDIVKGCSHESLVELIRNEMKRIHDMHSKAAHIAEVQTDDLRELCSIAVGSEMDEDINCLTHEDLLRYIREELEKIKDNLLQESTRAQQLGDELSVLTQRYEGAETLLLEEHDEEVKSLYQQKDILTHQLDAMKDRYEQLLVKSSESQGQLVEDLQNAKSELELALLQRMNELAHQSQQSEELRRERKVLLDIIKQLCRQFSPIEVESVAV